LIANLVAPDWRAEIDELDDPPCGTVRSALITMARSGSWRNASLRARLDVPSRIGLVVEQRAAVAQDREGERVGARHVLGARAGRSTFIDCETM
jgi:hypothetical protein